MKKLYATLFSIAVILAIILTSFHDANTSPTQPPVARTLAPGEGSCSTGSCHSGSGATGSITMTFSGGTTYKADSVYTIDVKVNDATVKYGFEFTALDASNIKAGNATLTNATITSLQNAGNGRQYVGHKNANGTNDWSFQWTAPSSNVGDITFYYTGNGANGNNSATGDHIYSGSTTISYEPGAGVSQVDGAEIFYVQNPVLNNLNITYELKNSAKVKVDLFDVTGKLVLNVEEGQFAGGEHHLNKSLGNINSGLYIIRFDVNGALQSRKILVL